MNIESDIFCRMEPGGRWRSSEILGSEGEGIEEATGLKYSSLTSVDETEDRKCEPYKGKKANNQSHGPSSLRRPVSRIFQVVGSIPSNDL